MGSERLADWPLGMQPTSSIATGIDTQRVHYYCVYFCGIINDYSCTDVRVALRKWSVLWSVERVREVFFPLRVWAARAKLGKFATTVVAVTEVTPLTWLLRGKSSNMIWRHS